MSQFALKIFDYYKKNLWNHARTYKAFCLGKITLDEYNTIIAEQ